jgi:hypothetical protein
VAAHDWATWHPIICPERCHVSTNDSTTINQSESATSSPRHLVVLPRHRHVSSPYCDVDLLRQPCRMLCQPATSAVDVTHATCHHFSGDTCHSLISPPVCPRQHHRTLPRQLYDRTTYTIIFHVALYGRYRLYSHQILHVWKNEQTTISWSYNVCLISFKLRRVCINEAYTYVFFEEILSTLHFRPF